jgi:hypothetical protein
MSVDLDVSELATAYRRLVLWFGGQLIVFLGLVLGAESMRLVGSVALGAMGVVLAYYAYRTAKALGSGVAWLWALAMFVSVINMVTILTLSVKATRACRAHGVPVGLFGPKRVGTHG